MSTTRETQTLVEIIKQYEAAVNNNDADASAALYTKDAVWMPPGAADEVGRDTIREAEHEFFTAKNLSLELMPEETRLLGDDAGLVRLVARGRANPANADPKPIAFSAIFLFEKEDDEWRISHKIWNGSPTG